MFFRVWVTVSDRNRFGTITEDTFSTSLDWLDDVIAADALVEFDLLNQTQTALDAHDYALAVVAGWTVCELRVRALGRTVPGGKSDNASEVCSALEAAEVLDGGVSNRLKALRRRRNKWLHSGTEPDESDAIEAVALAAIMLQEFVPGLTVQATSKLLIL